MAAYIPTIGLEVHAELKTKTKMFCNSKNDPDETRPNFNVCPVCVAHPGTLPVINTEAVRHVLRVGKALNAKLADYTEFDRKNYFYADLPKGYQISQYEYPLVTGGLLNGVQITRIHLEEDTASSIHDDKDATTVVDYNRAGIPLMELVTEPVIRSAEEAGNFARELQLLLRYLNVSNANMEKGEMRVEANISMSLDSEESRMNLGTKVEIKNLNSFRAMEKAIEYEIQRQQNLLERGGSVAQETRGWNENTHSTFSQRIKEMSMDYRYFPDPDLPSLKLSEMPEFSDESLGRGMPELPAQRRARYVGLGVKAEDAEAYVRDSRLGSFFEAVIDGCAPASREIILASNYIANDLVKIIRLQSEEARNNAIEATRASSRDIRDMDERDSDVRPEIPISAQHFREIIDMISTNQISSRAAKDLLILAVANKRNPIELAREKGLFQSSDTSDLESMISSVIEQNPRVVSDFKAGKTASLEYLVGQCMKASRGAANPPVIRNILIRKLT